MAMDAADRLGAQCRDESFSLRDEDTRRAEQKGEDSRDTSDRRGRHQCLRDSDTCTQMLVFLWHNNRRYKRVAEPCLNKADP